ncbi:MAG: hypothetical protein HY711_02610, partial [Candidatus Melainabacteria bacterium]|nr:hypothetical protein [Candidatus Melainabacteria bacterium]
MKPKVLLAGIHRKSPPWLESLQDNEQSACVSVEELLALSDQTAPGWLTSAQALSTPELLAGIRKLPLLVSEGVFRQLAEDLPKYQLLHSGIRLLAEEQGLCVTVIGDQTSATTRAISVFSRMMGLPVLQLSACLPRFTNRHDHRFADLMLVPGRHSASWHTEAGCPQEKIIVTGSVYPGGCSCNGSLHGQVESLSTARLIVLSLDYASGAKGISSTVGDAFCRLAEAVNLQSRNRKIELIVHMGEVPVSQQLTMHLDQLLKR